MKMKMITTVFAGAAAFYAQPMHAQERWGSATVASPDALSAFGDLWMETQVVTGEDGAPLTTEDGREIVVDLGRLIVPQNRAKEGSKPIQLAFARLRGPERAGRAPVIYLEGGPGGSSTWRAETPSVIEDLIPHLSDGDLIFLDQRGTGRSTPHLRWRYPGVPQLAALADGELADELAVEMATRAREAFEAEGHDLAGYNSVEAARDVDALREALGYETVALFGFSYGTHLAIAYARVFPERLDALVLVGVEGPDQTLKLPLHMDTQFRKLSAMVAADPELGPEIPDMVALLERVQERLEREPMVVTLENPETGQSFDVGVGRQFFDHIIRRDIGDASDLPVFPRLLYSIDRDDPTLLRWFAQRRAGIFVAVNGMSAATDVASGASPERLALIEAQAAESLFGGAANWPMPLWNDAWRVPDLGDEYRSPLVSDVRALLLSGTLDWNTPPFQAEQLRWGMPNATHLVVRNAGHEQVLPHPEIQEAIVRFLRGEDVSDIDAAWPALEWVPLEGYDAERTHPSVPTPGG